MAIKMAFLVWLVTGLVASSVPAFSSTGGIPTVIEKFMAKQFPEAKSHFWVVNGAQWQTEDEVVVDVNTVVMGKADPQPSENRFLLLIVAGQLTAAQSIPLDAKTECNTET